jgi:hypothetical protein
VGQWPLTAGEYEVSGSLSSPSRGAFHLSLTVLLHYRSLKMFSLGGWSPRLPTRVLVPRGTQDPSPQAGPSHYGVLTLSDGAFQHLRLRAWPGFPGPTTPVSALRHWLVWALPASLATTAGISFDFFSSGY